MILSSLDEVVDIVLEAREATDAAQRLLVGIAGAPGAGKSTVAAALVGRLPAAGLLPMDGFHLPQSELRRLGRRERMGAPDTFDIDGFVSTLADVHNSCRSVIIPGFDRVLEEPVPGAATILQELSTVVVEGNYLLLWERALSLLDVTFFVEVEHGIRVERLVRRHIRFGKSAVDATAWAHGPDERNALAIEATAHRADHLIRIVHTEMA